MIITVTMTITMPMCN